jgi:hypothetical protein
MRFNIVPDVPTVLNTFSKREDANRYQVVFATALQEVSYETFIGIVTKAAGIPQIALKLPITKSRIKKELDPLWHCFNEGMDLMKDIPNLRETSQALVNAPGAIGEWEELATILINSGFIYQKLYAMVQKDSFFYLSGILDPSFHGEIQTEIVFLS